MALVGEYIIGLGYEDDFPNARLHNDIYLSDGWKVAREFEDCDSVPDQEEIKKSPYGTPCL